MTDLGRELPRGSSTTLGSSLQRPIIPSESMQTYLYDHPIKLLQCKLFVVIVLFVWADRGLHLALGWFDFHRKVSVAALQAQPHAEQCQKTPKQTQPITSTLPPSNNPIPPIPIPRPTKAPKPRLAHKRHKIAADHSVLPFDRQLVSPFKFDLHPSQEKLLIYTRRWETRHDEETGLCLPAWVGKEMQWHQMPRADGFQPQQVMHGKMKALPSSAGTCPLLESSDTTPAKLVSSNLPEEMGRLRREALCARHGPIIPLSPRPTGITGSTFG